MFVQTKWILVDDRKWPNELIHQLSFDNRSTTCGDNTCHNWNKLSTSYVPFHGEHVTHVVFISTPIVNHDKSISLKPIVPHVGINFV